MRWAVVGLVVVTASTAVPVTGQSIGDLGVSEQGDQAQEGTVLTMRDALERAVATSPAYRKAVNTIGLAGPQGRQAWGAFLPTLDLTYGTTQSFRRETQAVDFFGNPIENPVTETVYTSYANQYAGASVSLFEGGRRFHELGRARADAQVSRRAGERELNTVLANVQREYLEAQKQRAILTVEMQLLEERRRDLDATERLFALASKNRSDVLGAELDVINQEVAVESAQAEYTKRLLAVRTAVGDPSLTDFDVSGEGPMAVDPASLDIRALLSAAMATSPEVREQEATYQANQAALKVERSGRWPTVSLQTGFRRQSYAPDQEALFDLSPTDFAGSVGLTVQIPILNGFFDTSYRVAQADANLRNAAEDLRRIELEVEERIRARHADLQTASATLERRERAFEIASERLRIVQEEYRLANKSFEDLQIAVREASTAQRDLVDQRFTFASALVDLNEAAGIVAVEAGLTTPTTPADEAN